MVELAIKFVRFKSHPIYFVGRLVRIGFLARIKFARLNAVDSC